MARFGSIPSLCDPFMVGAACHPCDVRSRRGRGSASHDRTAIIWAVETGQVVHTLTGHTDWVSAAGWSPDGTRIVTAAKDRTLVVWDTKHGAPMARASLEALEEDLAWKPESPVPHQLADTEQHMLALRSATTQDSTS